MRPVAVVPAVTAAVLSIELEDLTEKPESSVAAVVIAVVEV